MSMETLRRMQSYYEQEDRWTDQRDRQRYKDRSVVLSEEETQKQGEELYAKVVKSIRKQLESRPSASISCQLRPNCVFDYVVNKLKSKGWEAEHVYNDGFNAFDHIDATPPDPTENL